MYLFRQRLEEVGSTGYGRPSSAKHHHHHHHGGGGDGGARTEGETASRDVPFKVGRDRLVMVRTSKGSVAFERFPGEGGRA
jgi:hypothetical protein